MQWASSLSVREPLEAAFEEAAAALEHTLGAEPDLLLVFVTPHHAAGFPELTGLVRDRFPRATLLGCSAGGVIGGDQEVERSAALALTAARMPGVTITPFAGGGPHAPIEAVLPATGDAVIVLADPYACDPDALVAALDAALPGVPKVGGLASGAHRPGRVALFLDEDRPRGGAVGVVLEGNVQLETLVAQGCRPVGEPMIVARHEDNLILELDLGPPLEVLRALHASLPEEEQRLIEQALFIGVEMKPTEGLYHPSDFLIRNVLGADPSRGGLAIGQALAPYSVVQFHVRDAASSAADLDARLARAKEGGVTAEGALLFSCLGRGEHLYGVTDHDTQLFHAHLGPTPIGGFFCNGEIGPVQGTTFVHGYTSSFGLFRARGERP